MANGKSLAITVNMAAVQTIGHEVSFVAIWRPLFAFAVEDGRCQFPNSKFSKSMQIPLDTAPNGHSHPKCNGMQMIMSLGSTANKATAQSIDHELSFVAVRRRLSTFAVEDALRPFQISNQYPLCVSL